MIRKEERKQKEGGQGAICKTEVWGRRDDEGGEWGGVGGGVGGGGCGL